MFHAHFLKLPDRSSLSLQEHICELISAGIARDLFPAGDALPSCRGLSTHLGVSRNTVHEAYCRMINIGLIEFRDRSGYRVCPHTTDRRHDDVDPNVDANAVSSPLTAPLTIEGEPPFMRRVDHSTTWREYPYPFIYNQIDAKLFPLRE